MVLGFSFRVGLVLVMKNCKKVKLSENRRQQINIWLQDRDQKTIITTKQDKEMKIK